MLAYAGVCWPILRAMWAHLVAMLAYVGLMLIHVEPKDPKNGNSKITLLRVIPTMTFQNSFLTPLLSEAFVTGLLPN